MMHEEAEAAKTWIRNVMTQAREHGYFVAIQMCEADITSDDEVCPVYRWYSHHPSVCKGLLYDAYQDEFREDAF